jgi:hypothetical protein
MDVIVVNVAMPTIGRSLHASGAELGAYRPFQDMRCS